MKKRSFFQKLTGSYPFDEEDEMAPESQEPAKHLKVQSEGGKGGEIEETVEMPEEEGELTIDMYQTKEALIIEAMVAGVKPENLDISITREMVTIRGHREEQKEATGDDYFYQELYWGSFSRTIVLPQEIEPEESSAKSKNGLLKIRLPKINKEKMAKLRVKAE